MSNIDFKIDQTIEWLRGKVKEANCKGLSRGQRHRQCPQGHRPAFPQERIRVDPGTLRLRQDHHAEHHRRSGSVHRG